MLKTIQTMESREASKAKAIKVANVLDGIKLKETIRVVRERCAETPTYTGFPRRRSRRIRANNATERLDREIRRRLRAVGNLPGRQERPHARHSPAQVRHKELPRLSLLPERDAA